MAKSAKEPKKEKGGGGGVVGFIVVTVLAAALGGGFGFFLYGQMPSEAAKPAEEHKAEEKKPPVPDGSKLVALAPIVTNLAEPRDVWMRIEASILVEGITDGVDVLATNLSEDIVAYLKTASLSQFEGSSGFQNLREDLMDRARVRDGAHIKDLIIYGVVVE